MYRKIIDKLAVWKDSLNRKPLILLGARQVGKTWALKEFGNKYFQNVAYLNCDEEPLAKDLFSDYNIPRIILTIQAITGVNIKEGKTLLILDEIQEAPRGLHCLKYFCENAPDYHVVAAGSLLGITLGKKESFPVGKVNIERLFPMDFEEFVMAVDDSKLIEYLHNSEWESVGVMKAKYIELLRQYYFVGGMPEIVSNYVKHKDFKQVRALQEEILTAYRADISKHASKTDAIKICQIIDSFPAQLSKENKKFIYGVIKQGARAAQYEFAIQWLVDAGIVYKVPRVSNCKFPLKVYEDSAAFKLFFLDCGLFGYMVQAPAAQVIASNNIFTEYKGAFTELYVHQQLTANGISAYYWSNDRTPAELDFVIQTEDRVIPIEVKAEENVRSKSMSEYIRNNSELRLKGVRFSMKDYICQDWMENVPLYAISKYIRSNK